VLLTYRDEPLVGADDALIVELQHFVLATRWGVRRSASGIEREDATSVLLRNDRFALTVFRRPVAGPSLAIGLTATWDGQPDRSCSPS
jgi:hypothetical protein